MRVSGMRVTSTAETCELWSWVESDAHPDETDWFAPFPLWWKFPAWLLPLLRADNGDPFLAALLLPAMRLGEPLHLDAPVSPRLLAAVPTILATYEAFDPRARRITIAASPRTGPLSGDDDSARIGLFFSMGVDSTYSLLENLREPPAGVGPITHLISLHGIDVDHDGWSEEFPLHLLANFERVARETGKTLIPVVTNVRKVGSRLAPWTMHHGAALASVALALGGGLRAALIASSASYGAIYPWGTHPDLDPLWSTEGLTFIHDGCEADLIAKIAAVSQSPLALETLRVCPGFENGYNCGRCMKCLRTAIALLQSGALERCQTLPHDIDPEDFRIALRGPRGPVHRANFQKRLDSLVASGLRPDLQAVIADHLRQLDQGVSPSQESRQSNRPSSRIWDRFSTRRRD